MGRRRTSMRKAIGHLTVRSLVTVPSSWYLDRSSSNVGVDPSYLMNGTFLAEALSAEEI